VRDATGQLHAQAVDQVEFMEALSMRLGGAQFTSITRIDIPDGLNPKVSIHYSKSGRIAKVESSLSDQELEAVARQIERDLLATSGMRYARQILFANRPAVGYWSCDQFALWEPPQNALLPPVAIGEHPLVLEYAFDASADAFTTTGRMNEVGYQHGLLLSLFVAGLSLPKRSTAHHWGIVSGTELPADGYRQPAWFQEFYDIAGYKRFDDRPTDTSGMRPMLSIPDGAYYERAIHLDEPFPLPESLGAYVAEAFGLAPTTAVD
jgi:hypothetical protein